MTPGVPQPPPAVVARSTSRALVTYEIYVLAYAAQQRLHVLLLAGGVAVIIGAAVYASGAWLVLAIALGIGLAMAGGVGFAVAMDAHNSYTRDLAISTTETYEQPRREPPPATVRAFVSSQDGGPGTIRTGRLDFSPPVWQSLFDRALANGGAINRDDVAKKCGIGRQWYYGDGYGHFMEELTRMGLIDARNRLTDKALAWYAENVPLPLAALPSVRRPSAVRPSYARTDDEMPLGQGGL